MKTEHEKLDSKNKHKGKLIKFISERIPYFKNIY